MNRAFKLMGVLAVLAIAMVGCRKPLEQIDDSRRGSVEEIVLEKWGKRLDELPTVTLIAISPHHEDIQDEFEWAFSLWHAREFGQTVEIKWRDVGGGTTSIEQFIRNRYADSDTAGIDILWGGGELMYILLAAEGRLATLALQDDVLEAVPATMGGVAFIDPDRQWVGSAVSAFGFLYNKTRLEQLGVTPPTQWADLGNDEMFGLICLADPTMSGSSRAAMELIVQSGDDWPDGWGKLLDILSNASQFVDSASAAADAPVQGTAAVATAIDFYGTNRVAENPDALVFVFPQGEVIFTPDPIGILANPPHPELAQQFVDFVMSLEGQALLTLPVGAEGGPIEHFIGRTPIRKDFFADAPMLPVWTNNPYAFDDPMVLDTDLREACSSVLPVLVKVAAVDNQRALREARESLMGEGDPVVRRATFHELPENVRTVEQLRAASEVLRGDEKQVVELKDAWRAHFVQQYRKVGD